MTPFEMALQNTRQALDDNLGDAMANLNFIGKEQTPAEENLSRAIETYFRLSRLAP